MCAHDRPKLCFCLHNIWFEWKKKCVFLPFSSLFSVFHTSFVFHLWTIFVPYKYFYGHILSDFSVVVWIGRALSLFVNLSISNAVIVFVLFINCSSCARTKPQNKREQTQIVNENETPQSKSLSPKPVTKWKWVQRSTIIIIIVIIEFHTLVEGVFRPLNRSEDGQFSNKCGERAFCRNKDNISANKFNWGARSVSQKHCIHSALCLWPIRVKTRSEGERERYKIEDIQNLRREQQPV